MKHSACHIHANFGMWHYPNIYLEHVLENIVHAIPEVFGWGTFKIVNQGYRGSLLQSWPSFRRWCMRDTMIHVVLCWQNIISSGKHV
jgi:hypothetical protein